MKLSELLEALPNVEKINYSDVDIKDICYDSRNCKSGSLFIAVRGAVTDGHKYIQSAVDKGSSVVLVEEYPANIEELSNIVFIKTANCRLALADLSHRLYNYPSRDVKMIGVTGTNGKTTITFIIKSLLEAAGIKTGIIGTTGIFVGNEEIPATHTTPESLELCQHLALMREKKVEAIVMEVSSHALHQHRVRGVEFDAGIYTNLTHEHLDYHKTLDEYAAAKKRLFDMLPEDSLAVVNSDADYAEYMLKDCRSAKKIRVGRTDQSDICIRDEKLNINSSEFSLSENGNISNYSTKLIGRFNIDNIAQSLALCAFVTGRKIEDLKDSIINAEGAPGRMQRTNLKNGSIGIVDYAHTPDALEKALTACRDILETSGRQESRLYCVFGCGGDRDSAKRPIMGELSGRIADFSIITDDNPRTEDPGRIIEQIYNGVGSKNKSKIVMISDRREAIGSAVKMAGENDIILIAGKGHEDYQIVGTEKTHFDDREELEKFS